MVAALVSTVAAEMKVAEGVPRGDGFGEATAGGGVAERMAVIEKAEGADCAEMEDVEAVD